MSALNRRRFVIGAALGAALLGTQAQAGDQPSQSIRPAILVTATPLKGENMAAVERCAKALIEQYLGTIPDLLEIKTQVTPSKLIITLQFKTGVDMDAAVEEVEAMVAQLGDNVPADLSVSTRGKDLVA